MILPHLLSLADAFDSVDAELDRLANTDNNNLRFIAGNRGHICSMDDETIALAFGTLPFRANPQGTRSKKYENKHRRINDAGSLHDPHVDGLK